MWPFLETGNRGSKLRILGREARKNQQYLVRIKYNELEREAMGDSKILSHL